ncbi:Uncharacterised protein [Acinetobacter baumannii]|nr:Uncharacterised protein [Acinetobacter baumannii]
MLVNILTNSFGGLESRYHLRNLVFGAIFGLCAWLLIDALESGAANPKPLSVIVTIKILIILNSLLYPYAKYFYDYLWGFLLGDRVYAYSLNPITIFFVLIMRYFCWCFAIVLAPIALLILYFKNS